MIRACVEAMNEIKGTTAEVIAIRNYDGCRDGPETATALTLKLRDPALNFPLRSDKSAQIE